MDEDDFWAGTQALVSGAPALTRRQKMIFQCYPFDVVIDYSNFSGIARVYDCSAGPPALDCGWGAHSQCAGPHNQCAGPSARPALPAVALAAAC